MALYTRPNNPELDAVKAPSAFDIAWAAGVFEGEGTVRNCGRGKRSLAVCIPQKDPEILYWLRDWFGGSVNPPSGANNCYHLDLCGDRARFFMAQIYSRLGARRKAQTDETGCLDFLKGLSPEGLSSEQLKTKLLAYYEENFALTWRGNAQLRKQQQAVRYHKQAADPEVMATIRERNRKARAAMTPKQKEASRAYQQKYYQNKKTRTLNVVPISQTA